MEAAVVMKLAGPVAATVAKGLLGSKLEDLYKLIKYRINGSGEAYHQVKALVSELDLEAKLDTVGALLSEINSHSPSIQTALRHLHSIVDKLKSLLESIAELADEHSKKWFFGWRSVPVTMMEYLKQLKEYTGILDIRLNLLLLLLAAQPSALSGGEDIPIMEEEAPTKLGAAMIPTLSTPAVQIEPLGPRHFLNPLEQSWLLVDKTEEPNPNPEGQEDSPITTIPVIPPSPPNPPTDYTRIALLEELKSMGFPDPLVNAKALKLTNNDLIAALSLLIEKE